MIQRGLIYCALAGALWCGCDQKRETAPTQGAYGPPAAARAREVTRTKVDLSAPQPWKTGGLSVIQAELSPATLYHSTSRTLSFFTRMAETGIGGPKFAAMSTELGPKIFQPGQKIDPALMRESWFVVWFAGATNWTNWDSPWLLTLQRRPAAIHFDTNGLHFTFATNAGYAALMPMYGYYKSAQLAQQPLPFYEAIEKKKRVLTWEWFKALPADPLARARYWASVLREFPLECEASFNVDAAHDSVTIRQSFRWLSWDDDWNTKHWKLAPVSPVLALAYKEGLAADFSKKSFDMEICTSHGPYYGVENVDSYDVTLPMLRYVNETAGAGKASTGWSNASCFDAWRQAHVDGSWESLRSRWPALRDAFRERAPVKWTTFSGMNVSPIEQTADALGAARIAYRLGDADTYAIACERFARTFTQLFAQQRGLSYFRERQPWRSMKPMEESALLTAIGVGGWQTDSSSSPLVSDRFPDLMRLWRDTQLVSGKPAPAPQMKFERLIPGHAPTGFLPSVVSETLEPLAGLVSEIDGESLPRSAKDGSTTWPRLVWKDWKTPTGAAWNFGQVSPSTNESARSVTVPLNANTRVTIYSAP